jgi:hypothetical protein
MADIPQLLLLLTARRTLHGLIFSARKSVGPWQLVSPAAMPSRVRRPSPPLLAAPKPAKVMPHFIPANSDWGGVIVPSLLAALKPDRRAVKPRVLYIP